MSKQPVVDADDLYPPHVFEGAVSREEAMDDALGYFGGNAMRATKFLDKYAVSTPEGEYFETTPNDMHLRLAYAFSQVEEAFGGPGQLSESEIYEYLVMFQELIPNGSPMAAIGNPYQAMSLSNCLVVGNKADSYGGIMTLDEELAQLMKRRAGVGTDISHLRPSGEAVHNAARTSTGAASFMGRFSQTTGEVAQSGRRGALMLTIDIAHPDAEAFIDKKMEDGAVTNANVSVKARDEFIEAALEGDTYVQRFPVGSSPEDADVTREVDAARIWNKIASNAHESAEPGLLFWDRIKRESPADEYADVGFDTISTNPCFRGDTLIATADGREAVPIKDLAEEGKDVDVYAVDPETGEVEIKRGRNPRITGKDESLLRIHFSGGDYLDVTPDHKFPLRTGETKRADQLEEGDRMMRFTKRSEPFADDSSELYYRINTDVFDDTLRRAEHRMIVRQNQPETWKAMYQEKKSNGWHDGGLVVHHRNFDGLDNRPENLELMTFENHADLHTNLRAEGEANGNYSGVSNDALQEHGTALAESLGRRFSKNEWQEYAKRVGLPQKFTDFRQQKEYSTVTEFGAWCASQAGVDEFIDEDPRVVDTYFEMKSQGYKTRINDGNVEVKKHDELTGEAFWVSHLRREISFASVENANLAKSDDEDWQRKQTQGRQQQAREKASRKRQRQIEVFVDLAESLGRDPLLKEWKEACHQADVSKRLRTKYGFDSYSDLKEEALAHNHRVEQVEDLGGDHTVYNITVDDHHTVAAVTDVQNNTYGANNYVGVFSFQCGEVPLADGDSCRLLAMNWFGFVRQKYTGGSYFHEDDFYEAARVAQRLMDDIVEIEIAHVDRIIDKIESDPEPDRIKRREKELWQRVRDKAVRGRRTGLGMTGLGDSLAALGIRYGSEESIEKADRIAMLQKHAAYEESVELAKERGAFPEFDAEKESGNPFLDRLDSERPDIGEEMKTHGRRNIAVLSIAPTGTVSLMAEVTSGVENLYEPYYYRKTKVGPEESDEKVDFVDDEGTRWSEWVVFHPRFEDWLEKEGHEVDTQDPDKDHLQELYEKSPYHGATVEDVDWANKVRIQGAIQQHIDHSISVCLAGDNTQMVQTEEGLRYIEDIAANKKGFHSIDPVTITNHRGQKVEVDSAYGNGEDEIWEVSLRKKRNIRGTHRHKLRVVTDDWEAEWKKIEDLDEGDWVLSRIGEECFGDSQSTIASVVGSFEPDENTSAKAIDLPRRMTKNLARLLGYVMSDGSLSENSVQLSQHEGDVAENFADRLEDQFGISASKTPDDRNDVLSIRGHSRDLVRYFKHLGLSSGASTHNVPEVIFRRAGRQQSAEFIKGLTLDGHVAENGVAPITTASRQLAREVALLLEQFGIEPTVHKGQDAHEMVSPTNGETYKAGECWVLFCTGSDARDFVKQIGFAEPSKQSSAEDIIPNYWEDADGRLYPDFGLRRRMAEDVYPALGSNKARSAVYAAIRESRFGRDLRASTLDYWADLGLDLPWPVKDKNWTVSKVQSVDQTGETIPTYDLEVEEGSSYVVNGVVSHNTTNLPEDISVEKVEEVYRISYEAGCKGSTVYRQGSRQGVLNQESSGSEGVPSTDAPKRPEKVPCALHNIRYSGDLWRVVVGFLENDPYEVFAFKTQGNDNLDRVVDGDGESFDEGTVRKAGSQHYQLVAPDGHVAVDNITDHAPSDEVRAQTRLISTNLRHGADLKFVVKQLEKAEGSIVSFSNSVAKALAQHLEEGDVTCDECGSTNVQFKEGCMTCVECGHSRCS